jgi:hypothetical protein
VYIGNTVSLAPKSKAMRNAMPRDMGRRLGRLLSTPQLKARSKSQSRDIETDATKAEETSDANLNRQMYERAPDTYTQTISDLDQGSVSAVRHAVRSATACRRFFITLADTLVWALPTRRRGIMLASFSAPTRLLYYRSTGSETHPRVLSIS